MSVINQMLKDLDERKPHNISDREHDSLYQTPVKSSVKPIIIAVVITVVCAVVVFSLWQMNQQNKQLTEQLAQKQQAPKQAKITTLSPSPRDMAKQSQELASSQTVISRNQRQSLVKDQAESTIKVESKDQITVKAKQLDNTKELAESKIESVTLDPQSDKINVIAKKTTAVSEQITNQAFAGAVKQSPKPKATISIARRQLSALELAEQKFKQAEQALALNQIHQAESLFEEVVLLTPHNNQARQQLAALWFGRQDYQAAINLLQQGLLQAPDNVEFRLMQARILQRQGNFRAAYGVLKERAQTPSIDYQALLANAAQQSQQFSDAIEAYQFLVQAQPQQTKWLLGLAVAYDSNSQFEQALITYRQTVQQGGLSATTLAFAKQRLQELGE